MPRLLIVFFVVLLGILALAASVGRGGRIRGPRYRPRGGGAAPATDAGLVHLVRPDELTGTRDAYTSAAIDPRQPLFRCGKCLVFYQSESHAALQSANHGRCVACGSDDLAPVRLIDEDPA